MIQISRIEQVVLGQGERLLSREIYTSWTGAMDALRNQIPALTPAHEHEIQSHPDTQIGPITELVLGHGAAYSAAVLYDVRIV